MKVWLAWSGRYSDASVVGVYSTPELAAAAATLHGPEGWSDEAESYTVDGNVPLVRAGVARWHVYLDVAEGTVRFTSQQGVGTGEPARVLGLNYPDAGQLKVACDARDHDHAVKIAGDERRQYLAQIRTA